MGKLRHQQALRLQDMPGSCVILLHPKSSRFFSQSHQDCEDAGVCPSSQLAGSKSENAAAIRVLGDREGGWQPPGSSPLPGSLKQGLVISLESRI